VLATYLATFLATLALLLLSYLLVAGAWQKFGDQGYFQQVISDYRILPASWSAYIARGLALLELGLGLVLLIPTGQQPALVAVALLLLAYTAAMAMNLVRGRRDLDCGCAGPGQRQTISGWLLARNLLLIALALGAIPLLHTAPLGWLGWCLALLGAALTALLYHVFNQLTANNKLLRRIAHHG
jgi:hypothetical protein